jgi:ppGpp synthetase/RelA/SpoT-type nucleotidyltranferase
MPTAAAAGSTARPDPEKTPRAPRRPAHPHPGGQAQPGTLIEKYEREHDRFDKLALAVAGRLGAALRGRAILHLLTHRTKEADSLRAKLEKGRSRFDYSAMEREFTPHVLDLAGVRVLLYKPGDRDGTLASIGELFEIDPTERFQRDHDRPEGYRASHRVAVLRTARSPGISSACFVCSPRLKSR